jgi:hypothetical protein
VNPKGEGNRAHAFIDLLVLGNDLLPCLMSASEEGA